MIKKFIVILALGLISLIALWSYLLKQINSPVLLNQDQLVTIKAGTSVSSFSQTLVSKGWITNRFWIRNYVRLHPELTELKAGTYLVKAQTTQLALIKQIVQGEEHQFSITFVEGSTLKQWLAQLAEHPEISQTLKKQNDDELKRLFASKKLNLEGQFFPETYAFVKGTTDKEILKRAYKQMHMHLNELWEKRSSDLPYQSPYEALIMASIIEKETAQVSEYPIIASVFINRLAKKMRLQTDPTVIYGLGDRYQGDITRAHLKEKTLYNTYRIHGLPPTPIAMPGYLAIKAALNPESTPYLYFVAKGEGYHQFSTNLKDHNKAVRAYLRSQKVKK